MKNIYLAPLILFCVLACSKEHEKCDKYFLTDTNDNSGRHVQYYYNADGTLSLIHDFSRPSDYASEMFFYENKRLVRIEIPALSEPHKIFFYYDVSGKIYSTCEKAYNVDGRIAGDSVVFEYNSDTQVVKRNHFSIQQKTVSIVEYVLIEYSAANPTTVTHYSIDYAGDTTLHNTTEYEYDKFQLPFPKEEILLDMARGLDISQNNVVSVTYSNPGTQSGTIQTNYQYNDHGYPIQNTDNHSGTTVNYLYSCTPPVQ